jgi:signal transduction histidine kinase/CheY-like chemotaxis protein/HPt (histidine-containing phosphotransfer) domain-containing protein
MPFRIKLFISSGVVVLLLWAATLWPIQRMIASNFDQMANDNFSGTRRSLASLQVEQVNHMRRAGSLVMNIPELRALIAEHNFEVSADNLASLQERLDNMATIVGSRFICVLDSRATLIAQNSASPWPNVPALRNYISGSPQAAPFVNRLFVSKAAASQDAGADYSLWVYQGKMYQVVGLPLLFSSDPTEAAHPDGALIMASPITQELSTNLAASHNCQITFLASGMVAASSLSDSLQVPIQNAYVKNQLPQETLFDLSLGGIAYRSYMQPLVDPASGTIVGAMLIQSSREAGIALQRKISVSLLAIMAAGLFLAATISFILSGAITRPVRKLLQGVQRVAGGDLDSSIHVDRRDEIGELAAAFNDMVVQLRTRQQLQRLVDESQAATKAKSQFLANMSHEIRTPLHGVIGMSNLLLSTELNERQRHYAELAKSSAEALTTLINDILDFSKIEAGKLELESREFDLNAVVEDAVELLAQKAFAKGVEMASYIDDDVPPMARGDANRLRQVLMNLIGNAVKFTEKGEIIIRASMAGSREGGLLVHFAITDTGAGIPADRMERLFKSFSQVDASTTRRYGGTGLGLAISKQLAELMGGEIGVESELGKGSTFWFTIALQPVEFCPAAPSQELTGVNVLVLHPSPTIQAILLQELTRAGMHAQSAGTRAEAEELLLHAQDAKPFNVILVDRNAPEWESLPFSESSKRLILTMPAEDLPTHRLKSLGFAGSAIKPVRATQLVGMITDVLSKDFAGLVEKKVQQPEYPSQTAEKPYRILLAEDNQINQIVASELLTRAGYGVAVVSDGQTAVSAFRDGGYDLVLMDCQMPVMDGLEATRAIRQAEDAAVQSGTLRRRVPIVALTANASNVDRKRCIEAGMDGYFQKPFRPRDLLDTVVRYLNAAELSRLSEASQTPVIPPSSELVISGDHSSRAHIDKSTLLESCSGSTELACTILLRFQKQVNEAIGEFTGYINAQDAESLARLSHMLKGTAGIIGAEPLSLAFAQMEQVGRSGQFDFADKELQQLRAEIDRCSAAAAEIHKELMTPVAN